ncbi:MAG: hypothetical protein V9G19_02260 [Tetrasphaera sp.]
MNHHKTLRTRRIAAVATVAASAGLAAATTGAASAAVAPAEPTTARAPVTVSITVTGDTVSGTATSTSRACLVGKQVYIYQQVGSRGGGDDLLFHAAPVMIEGPTRGTWSAGFNLPAGSYYSLMKPTSQCQRASSRTVSIVTAAALAKTPVEVTIEAQGTDLSGRLISTSSACVTDREVLVYRQRGGRGGGDDRLFARDTTFVDDAGQATWSTGNTGVEGKFYAVVRPNASCLGDSSPTVVARR